MNPLYKPAIQDQLALRFVQKMGLLAITGRLGRDEAYRSLDFENAGEGRLNLAKRAGLNPAKQTDPKEVCRNLYLCHCTSIRRNK